MLKLDLLALENWATNWQVNFNPNKCEVMKITHDKDKERTKYYISNIELKDVQNYKDLGVIISSDLSWSKHVEEIVNKLKRTKFWALSHVSWVIETKMFSHYCTNR